MEKEKTTISTLVSFEESMINSRIIFLNGAIIPDLANSVIAHLLYLDSINNNDINIYINSPGGSVSDGLAIIDTMEFVKSKINTIAIGTAASMAAVVLACGDKRYALKHSKIMIHQVYGGFEGTVSDVSIGYVNMLNAKKELMEVLSEKTGKDVKQLEKDCDRDYWLNAEQAKQYGIIDEVISKQ